MTINQASNRLAIDWQSFSVGVAINEQLLLQAGRQRRCPSARSRWVVAHHAEDIPMNSGLFPASMSLNPTLVNQSFRVPIQPEAFRLPSPADRPLISLM